MVKSKEQKVKRQSFDKLRTGRKKVKVRLCCIVTCQRTKGRNGSTRSTRYARSGQAGSPSALRRESSPLYNRGGDAHLIRPVFAFGYAAASPTMGKLLENKE
jgi:hypothetical protein